MSGIEHDGSHAAGLEQRMPRSVGQPIEEQGIGRAVHPPCRAQGGGGHTQSQRRGLAAHQSPAASSLRRRPATPSPRPSSNRPCSPNSARRTSVTSSCLLHTTPFHVSVHGSLVLTVELLVTGQLIFLPNESFHCPPPHAWYSRVRTCRV